MTTVYLIPAPLHSETTAVVPPYVIDAIKQCKTFFVENERTTRRYFKKCWKEMVIDDYAWHTIDEASTKANFLKALQTGDPLASSAKQAAPAWPIRDRN